MNRLTRLVAIAVTLIVSADTARANLVTVGSFDSGNCYPFSCIASDGGTTYQQIYDASQFSGISTINSISFFQWQAGNMDSADYQISFSTTSAAVNGLDSTWANNIGGDSALFGNYSLSGAMPAVLTFTGNAFTYNPGLGNLLMTVQVSNFTVDHGYESFFWADYTGVETQRLYAYGNSAVGDVSTGALVTEFNVEAAAVPEPATMALLALTGIGGIGLRLRQRRKGQNAEAAA